MQMWSSFGRAFRYAAAGVIYTLRAERNMRIHWTVMMLSLLVELVIRPRLVFALLVLIVGALVIALELVNTAVERVVDLVVGDKQLELARFAKDTSAGAVLIVACGSFVVGVGMLIAVYPWHWYLWTSVHANAAWLNGMVLAVFGLTALYAAYISKGST
jgi:diacylglycerol kinase (ATP)